MLLLAALLSAVTAGIHLAVTPDHMAEMAQHGVFMLVVTACQLLSAALLLWRPACWVLALTIAGNLVVIAVAVVAYTTGLPAWLPGADGAEALNVPVVAATLAEVGIVGCCVRGWYTERATARR